MRQAVHSRGKLTSHINNYKELLTIDGIKGNRHRTVRGLKRQNLASVDFILRYQLKTYSSRKNGDTKPGLNLATCILARSFTDTTPVA